MLSGGDVLSFLGLAPHSIPLLAAAAFAAGAINAVAGGGSFLSFPALVYTGVPSVMANATSTMALFPSQMTTAWAYRERFPKLESLNPLVIIALSIVGGILGSLLLIFTPEKAFNALIPWLLLLATTLFAFSKRLVPWLKRRFHVGPVALCAAQFLVAVYGGYFGGAVGIMMLALFGLFGIDDIHSANALKTLLAAMINSIAVVTFAFAGDVAWGPALVMLVAAVTGGYSGARLAQKLPSELVRKGVVMIGVIISGVFFYRML